MAARATTSAPSIPTVPTATPKSRASATRTRRRIRRWATRSTPPGSRTLEEEGVVIDDFLLVDGGNFREVEFRGLLRGAKYPARSPDVNVADIKAQVAANEKGVQELRRVVAQYGWPVVSAYMRHVMNNAEESVRRVIERLGNGRFTYRMDNGLPLCVSVRVDRESRSAVVDFSGTGRQHDGNFNSPPAVTRAAVLYVFRCLVGDDIPLNDGCLVPLKLVSAWPAHRRDERPRCRRRRATLCSVRWERSRVRRRR